jgi:hypothetical protein
VSTRPLDRREERATVEPCYRSAVMRCRCGDFVAGPSVSVEHVASAEVHRRARSAPDEDGHQDHDEDNHYARRLNIAVGAREGVAG